VSDAGAGDRLDLGPASLLAEAPTVVAPDGGGRYVLSTDGDEPVLYSAVCPHQRGRVRVVDEGTLRCPNHRWTFDATTGACTSGEDASLESVPVERRDGRLYALVDGG
jgi:nitrite reductase/ring-hydroxylating ferredoxin subunit